MENGLDLLAPEGRSTRPPAPTYLPWAKAPSWFVTRSGDHRKKNNSNRKEVNGMAKEHPALRDCFEDLLDFFEGKRVLTQSDICRYTGRTPKWVKAHYGVGDHKAIGTKAFARMLCEPS